MDWVMTLLIGAVTGWIVCVFVPANAKLGFVANAATGVAGSCIGAYCVATASAGLLPAPLSWMIAIVSAVLALVIMRWLATPEPETRVQRRR